MSEETELLADQSLETVRTAIARLIPEAMDHAVDSYRQFVALEVPMEAKDFKEHHTAGRTALVHLESLMKLASWAASPSHAATEPEAGSEAFDTLLLDASRALTALRANSGEST